MICSIRRLCWILGGNVTFSGGFPVQQDFDRLTGVPKSTILHQFA